MTDHKGKAMDELNFEFEHQGRIVRPGQVLYVAPAYWWRAGPQGRVERYHGDTVTLRNDNGAVPTVPLTALSWDPHPETIAREELRRVGFDRPTNRDVLVWLTARQQGDELLEALKAMVNYPNLGAYERADAMKVARAAIAGNARPPTSTGLSLPSEAEVDEYLDDYEMVGEDATGQAGCYCPTDREKALIKDAIMGLLGGLAHTDTEAPGETTQPGRA